MHGVLLCDFKAVRRELRNLVGDPVKRGWEYLRANAGNHACEVEKRNVSFMENFAQLLILEATGDRLVALLHMGHYMRSSDAIGALCH